MSTCPVNMNRENRKSLTKPNNGERSQQWDLESRSSGERVLGRQVEHDPVGKIEGIISYPVRMPPAGRVKPEQTGRTAATMLPMLR